ncbi:MBL fold metallo-hydrolase [Ectobacillus antri]|jgi:L-ascorbate metabolism protein UlaG (beta-lactamase superfamily)|uniref:MBL fold metallo-hydrolase n=1 Tax=Ectobacillus antri TaxID=2486280 RepID=A0ABT6H5V1_9BACI|nr:MBL fold metallo-hydrolase [Ectobacillus antri]MDG4657719.1 MBL fold metallo-hydrolase [Ectobacillus antri]MDG5754726.1 MBL fold metallo-hydrolase [Ectobacillus antri]
MWFLLAILVLTILVVRFYPPLGRKTRGDHTRSRNFKDGTFQNQIETTMQMDIKTSFGLLRDFIKGDPTRRPPARIQAERWTKGAGTRITWFGHSAFLLELDGKVILLDPMFGKAPTPFPFGNKRYGTLPVEIENLPDIDVIVLSHDHYDHLDYGTIQKLKGKTQRFLVPLGVGDHLIRWGVEPTRITEHDWWEELTVADIQFVCTPARHFSGRSLFDRNASLWCSWVIRGHDASIFFSGDSGYGPHFKEIGAKYGPFDVTLMECGQYDARWAGIHMVPEETVQAHMDVGGKVLMPIHWGGFTLSLHSWTDPIERATAAARQHGVSITTPKIGQTVIVGETYPNEVWWK